MKLFGGILVAALLATPALAMAQTRPSDSSDTRSSEVYLDRAKRSNNPEDRQKSLELALTSAQKAIASRPDNPKGYFLAGQIYALLGNAAAADSAFDKAEQLWPEYAAQTERDRQQLWIRAYNAGIQAMNANNTEEAIRNFEQADAVWAKRPGARLNLGQLFARTNQQAKAIDAYRGALVILRGPQEGLRPEEVTQFKSFEEAATFNLAQLLAAANRNDEAIKEYEAFLARSPNHAVAKANLATVYSRTGKAAEAAKIYQELLSLDLSDTEFFNVGVGLYRAEQVAQAADAFRKAIAKNSQMREALYNLSQVLYTSVSKLQEERAAAKPADVKAVDAKLTPVLTELTQTAEKLRAIDPLNKNILALHAHALRGLADITADTKAAGDLRTRTMEVLKLHENLPAAVEDVQMSIAGENVTVSGNVVNNKGKAGDPVKLRVHFIGKSGQTVGTQEVTVSLPETQGAVPFKATLQTREPVVAWKYELIP